MYDAEGWGTGGTTPVLSASHPLVSNPAGKVADDRSRRVVRQQFLHQHVRLLSPLLLPVRE